MTNGPSSNSLTLDLFSFIQSFNYYLAHLHLLHLFFGYLFIQSDNSSQFYVPSAMDPSMYYMP